MALSIFVDRSVVMPGGGQSWDTALAALHLVAAGLLVIVVLAWGRHGSRRRLVASGSAIVVLLAVAYRALVRPGDIPTEWITILHEGSELMGVMHLYAS